MNCAKIKKLIKPIFKDYYDNNSLETPIPKSA